MSQDKTREPRGFGGIGILIVTILVAAGVFAYNSLTGANVSRGQVWLLLVPVILVIAAAHWLTTRKKGKAHDGAPKP